MFLPPTMWRVHNPARQLLIKSLKATNTRQQIDFLQLCKKNGVFPASIACQKFPMGNFNILNGKFLSKDNIQRNLKHKPISSLVSQNMESKTKLYNTIESRVTKFQKLQLKTMISLKYIQLREYKDEAEQVKRILSNEVINNDEIKKVIMDIIDTECIREKLKTRQVHRNKFKALGEAQSDKGEGKDEDDGKDWRKGNRGIIVRAASTFSDECFNLLDRGKSFKLRPSKKDMKEVLDVGKERLFVAMRYANPCDQKIRVITDGEAVEQRQEPTPPSQDPEPARNLIKEMKRKFDEPQKFSPKTATPAVEEKIIQLRAKFQDLGRHLEETAIPENYKEAELKSLQKLLKVGNIAIQPTDKTSKIAIVDRELAERKLLDHLNNGSYERLEGNPAEQMERSLNNLLKKLGGDGEVKKMLRTSNSTTPRLYSFQKDHKSDYPDCKVRPVQPIGQCAIYKIDIMVSKILSQVLPHLSFRVKSKGHYIETLKTLDPKQVQFMASLDIENMYPTIPISNEAVKIVKDYLDQNFDNIDLFGFNSDDVITMLKFCLHNTYVEYKGGFYRQLKGVGTGSHTSPGYSEILVDYVYSVAIERMRNESINDVIIDPSLYMDDCWLAWYLSIDKFHVFHQNLNAVFPGELVFTFELEDPETSSITFLDLNIIRVEGKFEYELYQKETHSGRYLDYSSHCPMKTKLNIITTETRRVLESCSRMERAYFHLEKVRRNFVDSNYPEDLVTKSMVRETDRFLLHGHYKTGEGQQKKEEYDFVLKIPYVNEAFTRLAKKNIRVLGISARVVAVSGRSLGSMIVQKEKNTCSCALCKQPGTNVSCRDKHVVYSATCLICKEEYVGVSNRMLSKRMAEHEASVRLQNNRSALGTHTLEHLVAQDATHFATDRPSLDNLTETYQIRKLDRGRDTIEAYIKEGLRINERNPSLNTKLENGWIR